MKLEFIKMQSCGNDYIYVDCFSQKVNDPCKIAKSLSIRRLSVGSDGLVLILPHKTYDCAMRIFNADGSEAKMCGNAVRCVGEYLLSRGKVKGEEVTVRTLSGVKRVRRHKLNGNTLLSVDMGRASFSPKDVPVIAEEEVLMRPYKVGNKVYPMTCVSIGNPHAVINVDDFKNLDVARVGRRIENDFIFPQRTNVGFVKVCGDALYLKEWERGSGLTYSCGTGACAAVASCAVNGFIPFEKLILVRMKGGDLFVKVGCDLSLTLVGEAVEVFRGQAEI